jgi:hypothetical protein
MTLVLGASGFLVTWTGTVIGLTKSVAAIKSDTSERLADETSLISDKITKLTEHFEADQRTQDSRFGEVALSIRQYVANVEKEMHQIEIWGRDNFVLKSDFIDTAKRLEAAIDRMSSDIKTDLRRLANKLDERSTDN